jgi:hypothetical protein
MRAAIQGRAGWTGSDLGRLSILGCRVSNKFSCCLQLTFTREFGWIDELFTSPIRQFEVIRPGRGRFGGIGRGSFPGRV